MHHDSAIESLEQRRLLTTVSVAPITAEEDDGIIRFTATLDVSADSDIAISYRSNNGSARAGQDFTPVRSSFVIPAGAISGEGSISLIDDAIYEPSETFGLSLAVPRGVKLVSKRLVGTITDDLPVPTVSLGDATSLEGGKGQSSIAAASITLSHPSVQTIRATYETRDESATENADYRPTRATVVFRPGQVVAETKIRIVGDDAVEPDEFFSVSLTSAPLALIGSEFGTITIQNDDAPGDSTGRPLPFLSVVSVSLAEGTDETSPVSADFVVSLAASNVAPLPTRDVTVAYATTDGSATTSTGDYVSTAGVLTFAAGETSKTISVAITADDVPEPDETFTLTLTQSANAIITAGTATATILNDDAAGEPLPPVPPPPPAALPTVSIAATSSVVEGNVIPTMPDPLSVTTTLQIAVFLSAPSANLVTVAYTTGSTGIGPGHAGGAFDYAAIQATVNFAPGQTEKLISMAISGDLEIEPDETFAIMLLDPFNATLGNATSVVTIINDDGL